MIVRIPCIRIGIILLGCQLSNQPISRIAYISFLLGLEEYGERCVIASETLRFLALLLNRWKGV